MPELKAIFVAVMAAVKAYPNGLSIVLGLAVIFAARFGLHVTVTEMTGIAAAIAASASAFAHQVTVPKTRITPPPGPPGQAADASH